MGWSQRQHVGQLVNSIKSSQVFGVLGARHRHSHLLKVVCIICFEVGRHLLGALHGTADEVLFSHALVMLCCRGGGCVWVVFLRTRYLGRKEK